MKGGEGDAQRNLVNTEHELGLGGPTQAEVKAEEEKPAEPPKPSEEVVLLQEIRDALKK